MNILSLSVGSHSYQTYHSILTFTAQNLLMAMFKSLAFRKATMLNLTQKRPSHENKIDGLIFLKEKNYAGIFFVLPCIETYQKVDLRTITLGVPPQEVAMLIVTDRDDNQNG